MKKKQASLFQLKKSCALITGASSGLGAEFARQLAPHAAMLILVARRAERLESLSQELQQHYPHLCIHQKSTDLFVAAEREKLAAWILEKKIPLNLLINNAGCGDLGSFYDASWSRLDQIIELNIMALTHLTHLLLPTLREHAPSGLLHVGSIVGYFPLREYAVYAASKAYVNSFSHALRMEERCHGVTVTLLAPGPVPTEFFDASSRPGKKISVTSRAPAFLITSQQKVVSVALKSLLLGRASVTPNKILSGMVAFLRLIPFSFFQKIMAKDKKV